MRAFSATDVWAAGTVTTAELDSGGAQATLTEHWDGTGWHIVSAPDVYVAESKAYAADSLGAVGGVPGHDVWAVGDVISHWDGTSWTEIASVNGKPVEPLVAVVALSATDVWIVGTTDLIQYRCS